MRGTICLSWFFLKYVPLTQIQNLFFVAKKVWKCYIITVPRGGLGRRTPSLSLSASPDHPKMYTLHKTMQNKQM